MQKHNVILDMSCDKLTFWSGHCQYPSSLPIAINISVESHLSTSVHFRINATIHSALHIDNSTTSLAAPTELQNMHIKVKNLKNLKKSNAIETSQVIPSMRPTYQVSQTQTELNLLSYLSDLG